jgi:type II secretory pathway pseudopilin PulG
MKARNQSSSQRAFTRLELMMVLVTLAVLAGIALPGLAGTRSRSEQISCFSNLRQIGHAFHVWGNDHADRNPWWTAIREGGSYNAPGDPAVPWLGIRNNAYFQMAWISNQLGTPKMLVCPSDRRVGAARSMASNWYGSPDGGFLNPAFRNNAVSYMISLHSFFEAPGSILSGDRNIRFSSAQTTCSSAIGLVQTMATPDPFTGWTNAIHGLTGNLLYTDGSVEQSSNLDFQRAVSLPAQNENGSLHFVVPP